MTDFTTNQIIQLRLDNGVVLTPPAGRFDIVETLQEGIRWKIEVPNNNPVAFSGIVDGEDRMYQTFDFRFGSAALSEGNEEKGWYRGVVLKALQDTRYSGSKVKIIGGDAGLYMKSRARTKVWRGTFPSIVEQIAREYDLVADVDPPVNEVNPPCYWQYGINDWEFLRGWTSVFVSGTRGLSDYEMWIEHGKTLKFKPPGANITPTRSWAFGGDGAAIKRLVFVQRKQALQMLGGISVRGTAYDPDAKSLLTVDKNYGNYRENSALGSRVTLPANADSPSMTFSTGVTTQQELEQRAAARLGEHHRRMYMAIVDITPSSKGYEVGDVVNLQVKRSDTRVNDNTFSGNYIVEQRRTAITTTHRSMRLLLARVGSNVGERPVQGFRMSGAPIPAKNSVGRLRRVVAI